MSKQEKTTLYIIIAAAVAFYLLYENGKKSKSTEIYKPIPKIPLTPGRIDDIIANDDKIPEEFNDPDEMEMGILYPHNDLRQFAKPCW